MCRQVPANQPEPNMHNSKVPRETEREKKNAKRNGNILIATSLVVFPLDTFFFFASSASTLFDSFSAFALFLLLVPWRCRDKLMVYRHFTLRCKYRIENGYYCIAIHNLWRIFHAHGQMPGDNFRYFSLCCCCVCVVLGLWKIADAAEVKIQP